MNFALAFELLQMQVCVGHLEANLADRLIQLGRVGQRADQTLRDNRFLLIKEAVLVEKLLQRVQFCFVSAF